LAFFCQQAAEKALKATIYSAGERPWGHSVPSLLDQVCAILRVDPDGVPFAEAEALDEHYIRPRYPDARLQIEAEYDRETAEGALQDAHSVHTFVMENLSNA
jgi:HEPN domain-containing protein